MLYSNVKRAEPPLAVGPARSTAEAGLRAIIPRRLGLCAYPSDVREVRRLWVQAAGPSP